MGKIVEAVADYNKAIECDPAYMIAYRNRGNAKHDLQNYREAIVDENMAIAIDPSDSINFYNRGNTKAALEYYDEAVIDYEHSIQLNSEYAPVYYNLGNVYRQLNNFDDAIIAYDRAIELDPSYGNAYNNRGLAYRSLNDYDTAISDFKLAITCYMNDIDYAKSYFNIGITLQIQERWQDSITFFEQALIHNPNDWSVLLGCATSARITGEVLRHYDCILRARVLIDHDNLYNMACLESIAGNVDTALNLLESSRIRKPVSKEWVQKDPDLQWIRHSPRFKEIVADW